MNLSEVFYDSQWENSEIVFEIFVFIIHLAVNFLNLFLSALGKYFYVYEIGILRKYFS